MRMTIRCTVTRYSVDYGPDPHPLEGVLTERTREEITSASISPTSGFLYLGNSSSCASLKWLLTGAREGRGWNAQAGSPPVYVEGDGWGGRNYPKIYVEADALLELERALSAAGGVR
jgi:hypothetical protein